MTATSQLSGIQTSCNVPYLEHQAQKTIKIAQRDLTKPMYRNGNILFLKNFTQRVFTLTTFKVLLRLVTQSCSPKLSGHG